MKKNTRVFFISAVIIIVTFIAIMFFFTGNKVIKLNRPIPKGTISGFDLIKIAENELSAVKPGLKFHLGLILLEQDKQQLGKARIRFVEESKDTIPQVFEVRIDTLQSKLLDIKNFGRSDVSNPGSIAISDWKIDSTTAYQITQNELSKESTPNFSYNRISITSFKGKDECWLVQLFDSSSIYWCYINSRTGEVVEKGFKTPSK